LTPKWECRTSWARECIYTDLFPTITHISSDPLHPHRPLPIHPPRHTHPAPPLLRYFPLHNIKARSLAPPAAVVARDAEPVVVGEAADAVDSVRIASGFKELVAAGVGDDAGVQLECGWLHGPA
jgi:hypothetical protein